MNMWFKRENKTANGVLSGVGSAVKAADGKIRRRKPIVHKSTRESGEKESSQREKEKRRHSDIMDIKASFDRRESEESVYESAEGHSDTVSAPTANDQTLSHATSKDSVKLEADEDFEVKNKKGHRKTISLSTPIDIAKTIGDDLLEASKRETDKTKKNSKENLLSEKDGDSVNGSVNGTKCKLGERNDTRKDKTSMEPPRSKRVSSVSALNFLRRKKKTAEPVAEKPSLTTPTREVITATATFLDAEKCHACEPRVKGQSDVDALDRVQVDSDEELDAEDEESEEQSPPKPTSAVTRRRLSRTISRSKSRGKSQTVRVNALRKSQNGTLKRAKKKKTKAAAVARSRNASLADTPVPKKKLSDSRSSAYWPFSGSAKGDVRRAGSAEEGAGAADVADSSLEGNDKDDTKDGILWRPASGGGKPVNRAESCREPAAAAACRRGKQRNASDPNRLTGNKHSDCEAGGGAAAGAPSGSSSNSSLSSRSADSAAPSADQLASQSDFSEEEDALAEAWSSTVAPQVVEALDARLRKRQELIHELITSERSHARWLRVLQVVFAAPLERGEAGALLPADEVRALFPNLPAVRERHARLYADLRALRGSDRSIVRIAPLAEAILSTLGDPSYAPCLSRFCRGQRMALDALRERRRKSKELHQYLVGKEQHSLCGRLQLRELVAVVWQRLTKYQLLLEGVLRTVTPDGAGGVDAGDGEVEAPADVALLRRALHTAKDVLHRVDTAVRTAENEHRLKTIQSKLEVRGGGGGAGAGASETDELRRLDLTQHTLLFEGDLSIRTDTKKTTVLALMTQECLVLLQREGDKFVLKQMSQLTPIIKWSTVLFRPNAAVKNTFFLMNINGVQMYELSANSLTEYNTWTRYISEMPLAEARRATSVLHSRDRADESSGGVSRNASDASRTSASSTVGEEAPQDADKQTDAPADKQTDAPADKQTDAPADTQASTEEHTEKPEAHAGGEPPPRPQLTMNGRITTHEPSPTPLAPAPLAVPPVAPLVAARALSAAERLRRLDRDAARALRDKSALVAELLAVPPGSYEAVAELAVAETLARLDSAPLEAQDVHQLLLAAQAQANQLTEALTRALNVTDADVVAARHYAPWREDPARPSSGDAGLCDSCCSRRTRTNRPTRHPDSAEGAVPPESCGPSEGGASLETEVSFDMLSELERGGGGEGGERRPAGVVLERVGESSTDPPMHVAPGGAGDAWLATLLAPVACGLQGTLGALLAALAPLESERRRLRAELAALRERGDCARHAARGGPQPGESGQPPHELMDHNAQDQTNSGG